jgi:hypothetical protein
MTHLELHSLVPLAEVTNLSRSIDFYGKLGFETDNTHTPDGRTEPVWAWVRSGNAHLMLAAADEPVKARKHPVLFYLYCADVDAFRAALVDAGVETGPIEYPFWAPRGEFRLTDPDGYVLMITHT